MAKSYSEDYKAKFMSVFPELVRELTEDGLLNSQIKDAIQHLKEVSTSGVLCFIYCFINTGTGV